MPANTEPFELIGAACWASALINGDYSGLDESETAALNQWLAIELNGDRRRVLDIKRAVDAVDNESEDPWFSWSFGLFTHSDTRGGELLTYIAI